MTQLLMALGALAISCLTSVADVRHEVQLSHPQVSRGGAAGPCQAFPDACRLKNGDIACVFYAGYEHASQPTKDYPQEVRIGIVRSTDEGRARSEAELLFDGPQDDREPHLAQLSDGRSVCTVFTDAQMNDGIAPPLV